MINDFLFRGDVDTQKIQEILRVYQIARSEGKSYFPSEFSRTFLDNDIDTSKILTRQDYINALNEAGLSEIDLLTSFGEDYMLTVIRKVD